ncbi:YibE/F family protein [Mesobacillus boroniphilus]|uniref:YibE/F family protein n=1 Tax=Mesobacillus boroniphilus TaxID=308892 RepID=A0A944CQ19_9BACI|nr:YibE/F family protein [Mesobacillus boroniphilus]MBS8266387.1 YibE/F family protein [Mesobacillus boroniphilus]
MNLFKHLLNKLSFKKILFLSLFLLFIVATIVFVHNNHFLYERTIVKVLDTELVDKMEVENPLGNKDHLFTQRLIAKIKNGEEEGELIYLVNEFSTSKAYDHEFVAGDELFVDIDPKLEDKGELQGTIKDVKRDKYLLYVAWVFVLVLLIVGRKQGLFSIISLVINALLLSYALDIYLNNPDWSLLLICSIGVVIFTVLSLLLVNGLNEKTYAAIIATLLGTFASLLIVWLVLWGTSEKGLRYEELQFITRPYHMVFLAGLFLGSLGAVMDVAITMSSSIFNMFEKNNNIPVKALIKSGMEIGKDIMGTMTNILFFVYISGSIPILILYFKNGSPLGFALSMNLSLEMARALAGGIGIVLTIPIGLYVTIFFINRKKARL